MNIKESLSKHKFIFIIATVIILIGLIGYKEGFFTPKFSAVNYNALGIKTPDQKMKFQAIALKIAELADKNIKDQKSLKKYLGLLKRANEIGFRLNPKEKAVFNKKIKEYFDKRMFYAINKVDFERNLNDTIQVIHDVGLDLTFEIRKMVIEEARALDYDLTTHFGYVLGTLPAAIEGFKEITRGITMTITEGVRFVYRTPWLFTTLITLVIVIIIWQIKKARREGEKFWLKIIWRKYDLWATINYIMKKEKPLIQKLTELVNKKEEYIELNKKFAKWIINFKEDPLRLYSEDNLEKLKACVAMLKELQGINKEIRKVTLNIANLLSYGGKNVKKLISELDEREKVIMEKFGEFPLLADLRDHIYQLQVAERNDFIRESKTYVLLYDFMKTFRLRIVADIIIVKNEINKINEIISGVKGVDVKAAIESIIKFATEKELYYKFEKDYHNENLKKYQKAIEIYDERRKLEEAAIEQDLRYIVEETGGIVKPAKKDFEFVDANNKVVQIHTTEGRKIEISDLYTLYLCLGGGDYVKEGIVPIDWLTLKATLQRGSMTKWIEANYSKKLADEIRILIGERIAWNGQLVTNIRDDAGELIINNKREGIIHSIENVFKELVEKTHKWSEKIRIAQIEQQVKEKVENNEEKKAQ